MSETKKYPVFSKMQVQIILGKNESGSLEKQEDS